MSLVFNMVGGGGGLNPSKPLIHVNALIGSTVDFSLNGVTVKTIPPAKAIANDDGETADYYYTAKADGTYTVTATLNGNTTSDTVVVSGAGQYDVILSGDSVPVEKIMTQGQVSDTSTYKTASFDASVDFSKYAFLETRMFRGGVVVGNQVVLVPTNTAVFYITGGGYTYAMVLDVPNKKIGCSSYAGSYVNLYVDVYGYEAAE